MTSSKKKVDQVITVDARKLSHGLKATFEGVAMVFDSIGVDAGFEVEEKPEKPVAAKAKGAKAEKAEKAGKVEIPENPINENVAEDVAAGEEPVQEVEDENEDATANAAGDDGVSDSPDIPADEPDDVGKVEKKQEAPPAPSISTDDVTKIIVQKIKKDRGNNEKIGQILKTYGAVKVGELDPAKYEAFLTDVAAL